MQIILSQIGQMGVIESTFPYLRTGRSLWGGDQQAADLYSPNLSTASLAIFSISKYLSLQCPSTCPTWLRHRRSQPIRGHQQLPLQVQNTRAECVKLLFRSRWHGGRPSPYHLLCSVQVNSTRLCVARLKGLFFHWDFLHFPPFTF